MSLFSSARLSQRHRAELALFCTVLPFFLQARFQARTTPERAALIFSTEPLFATGFGYVLLGEKLSAWGWLGAVFIVGACAGGEFIKARQKPLHCATDLE